MTDFGAWDLAEAVAVQPDGRIVVGGSTQRFDENGLTQSGDFALARYLGVPNCRVPNVIGKTLRVCEGEDLARELPARKGSGTVRRPGLRAGISCPNAPPQAGICRTEARSSWS